MRQNRRSRSAERALQDHVARVYLAHRVLGGRDEGFRYDDWRERARQRRREMRRKRRSRARRRPDPVQPHGEVGSVEEFLESPQGQGLLARAELLRRWLEARGLELDLSKVEQRALVLRGDPSVFQRMHDFLKQQEKRG